MQNSHEITVRPEYAITEAELKAIGEGYGRGFITLPKKNIAPQKSKAARKAAKAAARRIRKLRS